MNITITKEQLKAHSYPPAEMEPLTEQQTKAVARLLYNIIKQEITDIRKDA